jgi:hypothetical protein
MQWKVIGWVLGAIFLIIVLSILFSQGR